MKRLKKILCEDLLIVDIPVGTVYVSFYFFFICWQFVTHGGGARVEGNYLYL